MRKKLSGCVSSVVVEVETLAVTTVLLAGKGRLGVPVTLLVRGCGQGEPGGVWLNS